MRLDRGQAFQLGVEQAAHAAEDGAGARLEVGQERGNVPAEELADARTRHPQRQRIPGVARDERVPGCLIAVELAIPEQRLAVRDPQAGQEQEACGRAFQ